jgi:hypothetical protein
MGRIEKNAQCAAALLRVPSLPAEGLSNTELKLSNPTRAIIGGLRY